MTKIVQRFNELKIDNYLKITCENTQKNNELNHKITIRGISGKSFLKKNEFGHFSQEKRRGQEESF